MPSDVLITPANSKIDFTDGSNATKRLNISGTAFSFNSNLNVLSSTSLSSAFKAEGVNGTLFEVTDDLSNSLLSVNTIGGLPVFEVFANNSIIGGQYGANDFVISGNKIGLGLSNPVNKLSVSGAVSIGASYNVAAPANGLIVQGNVGIGTVSPTNGTLQVYNASGNTLSLQKSGGFAALAMGSETTVYALIESINTGGIRFYTGNGTQAERWKITSAGVLESTGAQTIRTSIDSLTLATNAGNGHVLLSPHGTGNVGIGIATPSQRLDVRFDDGVTNGEHNVIASFSRAGSKGLIIGYRADGTNITSALIRTADNTPLTLGTSATTQAVVLLDNGNLGIGTASPTQILDVRGNIKLGADNAGNYIYYIKDTEGTIISTARSDVTQAGLFRSDGWGNFTVDKSIGIGYSLGTGFASSTIGNGNLYVLNSIGVNTTSPLTKLDVRSGSITSGTANSTSGSTIIAGYYTSGALTVLGTEQASGGPVLGYAVTPSTSATGAFLSSTTIAIGRSAYTQDGGTHRWYIGASQTVAIGSAVTTSEVMRINSNGNVGIGTTTVPSPLAIYNNTDVWHFRFGGASGELRMGGQTNSGAVIQAYTPGGSVRDLYIQRDGGNIGVGLNNPSGKIHIYENANRVSYLAQNNVHTARFEAYGTATAIDTTASNGIFFRMSGADVVKFAVDGNVGINTTSPSYKLDVNGTTRFGGIVYNEAVQTDDFNYFNLQPYIESETLSAILSVSGTAPSFVTLTNTAAPFSKVLSVSAYGEALMSDYIPVQAGETIYGEIWTYRATGAAGTAGVIYCGVQRYDKDKKMIDGNGGLNTSPSGYFIASNQTIPSNSTWTKYSGTLVLPTSHTPYNTSDGGPVRYIRPYIIYNYTAGTILTYIGGWKIRKVELTRDAGPVAVNGSVAIGSNSVNYGRLQISAATTTPNLSSTNPTDVSLIISNSDVAYGTMFATYGDGKGALQQRRTNAATYYDFSLQPHGGNVGIGTISPSAKLEISGSSGATIQAIFQSNDSNGSVAYLGGIQLGNAPSNQNSQIYHNSSGDNTLTFVSNYGSGTGNKFVFAPGGTERVRFQQNGNVGLGVQSTNATLHIKPTTLGANGLILERYASTAKLVYMYESAADGYIEVRSGADVIVSKISGYASTPTYFQSSVGIGTSLPGYLFSVNTATDVWHAQFGQVGGNQFRIGGNTTNGAVIGAYSDNTNNNPRQLLLNRDGGNVAVGASSANNKLHVNGSTSIGGGYNTAAPTNGLIVEGSVGIGNTNPIYKLQITGSTYVNNGTLFIDSGNILSWGNSAQYILGTNGVGLSFITGSAARMIISNSGNIGMGTASPLASLHVNSTTSGATLLRADGTNGTLFSVIDDLSDSLMSVNNSAGLPVLEVFADDRIVAGQYGANDFVLVNNKLGLGTNNPQYELDIVGSGTNAAVNIITRIRSTASSDTFNTGSVIAFTNTTTNVNAYSYIGSRIDLGGAGDNAQSLIFATNATNTLPTEKMRIKSDGNVGIGTAAPATLLQINTGTPTSATGGIQFGDDTGTRLYRSASGIVTCSGTIAATFSGNLTGNVTGNVTGSSGSCTGNAANVTGTVAIANGGSGQTSAQAAMNAFAGAVTAAQFLRGNGTNVVMSAIQAADVPTLNQNTTGSSGSCTGNAATASLATTSDRLTTRDNRTISPSSDDAYRLRYGFTSWANNNTSPYADYLHLRSYSDASGGNDNLVMFRKDAIGMRIYQAGFGTSVAYSSFKDIAFTDGSNLANNSIVTNNITNSNVTYAKIQNVSATSRILGRVTAGAGVIEELTAANVISILGGTTVGSNLFTLADPSAERFIRINAANTVSALDAATFRTAIGAGTGNGSVTSVGGTGTVSGLTLTGTVTGSGNLTLGGTLSVTPSNFASQTANTFLAAPNGAAGAPTFRAIVAADVPTLNQNTIGSSGSCTGNAATATNASQLGGAVAAKYVRNDTDGTAGDIYSLVTITKSLTLTTSWIDTGISAGTDLISGAYILTLNADNYAVGGGHYNETYAGTMYWYAGATNSTNYDEIPLHKSGHAPNNAYINLRTLRGVSGVLKLQIISSVVTSGASNYIFKFRRII